MSTLLEIDNRLERRLREFDRGDGGPAGDPISRREMILEATDEMARRTNCFWYAQTLPVVNEQKEYRASGLYKVEAANFCDANGNFHPLTIVEGNPDAKMDRHFGASFWRNRTTQTVPTHILFQGLNQFRLWPTPSVATADAGLALVELEGYHTPSKAIASYTTADPPQPVYVFREDDDCWPLPEWSEDGVVPMVAQLRREQFPTDTEIAARALATDKRRLQIIGDLYDFSMAYAPPYRFGGRGRRL